MAKAIKSIIAFVKNLPQNKRSQTRWSILQFFFSLSVLFISIFINSFTIRITLQAGGNMNTPVDIMLIVFMAIMAIMAIGVSVAFIYLVVVWVFQGSQDPMPTKDDMRNIFKEETNKILEQLKYNKE